MYANQPDTVSTGYLSPYDLGFRISPDITIKFIHPKTSISDAKTTVDVETDDNEKEEEDEDIDAYFNPLTLCCITMDEDDESAYRNEARSKEIDAAKDRKPTKNAQSNENSSSVCNGADSNAAPKMKKRFSCHVCEKTFGWTTDLKRHLLIHTGERPFKCTMCFATFTRNFLLQKHKSKIHQCLSPNEISQLNNNVAKNIMEIKQKMRELENEKNEDEKPSSTAVSAKKSKKKTDI